jgi:DMSO/TMAO reductase YedYZ molybdopterin-dependent catalytic subunit
VLPLRAEFWRSPLRGPWLTSVLGSVVLVLVMVVAVTGFLSHAAYQPMLGQNGIVGGVRGFQPFLFTWPAQPPWLYGLTQGLHVNVGLIAVPLVLAKLWSVIPRLFAWPPVRSVSMAVERISLFLLVGGALFEFATGIFNIQVFYPWRFSFLRAHYYGAWVFVSALCVHVAVKAPVVLAAWRRHGVFRPLGKSLRQTRPEPYEPGGLVPQNPDAPTLSRRGLLTLVGAGSLCLLSVNVGETVGGPLRRFALLAPRGRVFGVGPNDFAINRTAQAAQISRDAVGASWRLELNGARRLALARTDLLAMTLHSHDLPIACVEGWTTTQRWTGVRLIDLAQLVQADRRSTLRVESIEVNGAFRQTTLNPGQVRDLRSLLALRVNAADLSLDHGFPARLIVPALPGVHCTKWVRSLSFVPV